uniref:(northern house mosquito) hypothetical protein n=1 Tax=Culex pipiens TaxID=7175 RepID=A0A8D8ABE8_CULPI
MVPLDPSNQAALIVCCCCWSCCSTTSRRSLWFFALPLMLTLRLLIFLSGVIKSSPTPTSPLPLQPNIRNILIKSSHNVIHQTREQLADSSLLRLHLIHTTTHARLQNRLPVGSQHP